MNIARWMLIAGLTAAIIGVIMVKVASVIAPAITLDHSGIALIFAGGVAALAGLVVIALRW
jgi:hypothetical protein